ncbi:FecR domain-containing protein [Treponema sp. OMZ 799]|uniref:FecR family protein n=1 Tax=Treponema sp. OMZ 799 TaxID=2563668 RepID=UPI0020A4DBEB|nr:FecR family protein [Treponema sp. OMZ 799]UTC77718.1 FecR domain-containing protein [Treponema sp. OMZ 799]
MKKIFIVISLLCLTFSLMAMDGEVVAVKGKAEIKKGGKWIPAKTGNKIESGSMISTGFKSELTLKIDGSVITVRPMTRLTIEEIAKKNEAVSSEVYLNVGSVKADVKPASTKKVEFKVKTPVATASVRGTSGEISSDGLLIGTSGSWYYANNDGLETRVQIGDSVIISDTGMVTPAQNIKANDVLPQSVQTLAEAEANSPTMTPQSLTMEDAVDIASSVTTVSINIGWED